MATIEFNSVENVNKFIEYQEKLTKCVNFFTKNTILQFSNHSLLYDMYDCLFELREGTHTEFLAKQCEKVLEEYENVIKEYEKSHLKESVQELSRILSKDITENETT